jgi:3-oxoadipate enol-lactonase/4-carboxymuconolactone decarboxylase
MAQAMIPLAVRTDGPETGPVLVLLSSIGTTSDMWTPVVGPLAEQFRVVRIDHRGHGSSTPSPPLPEGAECTLAHLAADVVAALDLLEIDRVHLAGTSLGGMVGMWLAAHRPERIGRLALICTSSFLPPASGWRDRAVTVRERGTLAVTDPVVARWVTPALAARDQELLDGLRAMMASIDAESYAQCCEAIASMDLRDDLGRIAAPTLVVAAADDLAIPRDHAELIAGDVARARLELLAPAAHVPTYEQPGKLASLLLDHFGGGASLSRGLATRRAVLGDAHVDRALASRDALTAPFQDFLTRYAWGDVWSRVELSRRERSIATLGAVITLGADNEIALHVRAARRNGMSDEEIAEVVLHVALYAGLPRANHAMTIVREVLAEH